MPVLKQVVVPYRQSSAWSVIAFHRCFRSKNFQQQFAVLCSKSKDIVVDFGDYLLFSSLSVAKFNFNGKIRLVLNVDSKTEIFVSRDRAAEFKDWWGK